MPTSPPRVAPVRKRPVVQIELTPHYAIVRDCGAAEVIRRVLTVPGRGYDPTTPRWVPREDRVYFEDYEAGGIRDHVVGRAFSQSREVWFAPRLVPYVLECLANEGYPDPTFLGGLVRRPSVDTNALIMTHPLVHAAVTNAFARGFRPSLVVRPRELPAAVAVAEVIDAVPDLRVFVMLATHAEVSRWIRIVKAVTRRPVFDPAEFERTTWGAEPLVCVGVEASLRNVSCELCDLLVVPEVGPLLRSDRRAAGPEYGGFPILGFLAAEPAWTPLESLRSLQWFAGVVRPGAASVPTARTSVVVVAPAPAVPAATRGDNWRSQLWADPRRLEFIVELAKHWSTDLSGVWGFGVPLPATNDRGIALLVETAAHADRLSERLGWRVLAGQARIAGPLSVIVTDGWRASHPDARFWVVVDARAADPLRPVPVYAGGELVDVRDVGDPELERRHRDRLRAYSRAGLVVQQAA